MAILEISECFLADSESMLAIINHFDGLKELRYLRKPHRKTRTFYVETDNFKPSEQICPTLRRLDNGTIIIENEN